MRTRMDHERRDCGRQRPQRDRKSARAGCPGCRRNAWISSTAPSAMNTSSPKKRPTLSVAAASARTRTCSRLAQRRRRAFGRGFAHRRNQRAHGLRMPSTSIKAEHRQAPGADRDTRRASAPGSARGTGDPCLRALRAGQHVRAVR